MGKREAAKVARINAIRSLERFCVLRDVANLSRGLLAQEDPLHLRINTIKNEVEDSISILYKRANL